MEEMREEDNKKNLEEKEIDEALEKIIEEKRDFENPSHMIRLLAKLIYNLRVDFENMRKGVIEKLKDFKEEVQKELDEMEPEEIDGDKGIRELKSLNEIDKGELENPEIKNLYL